MEKKCNRYEAYYTFAKDEEYKAHIQECEECRKEYDKEQSLSILIKDSAKTYKKLKEKRNFRKSLLRTACAFLVFSTLSLYAGFEVQKYGRYQKFMNTNTEISIIAQEGLPTDEFGFFDYN